MNVRVRATPVLAGRAAARVFSAPGDRHEQEADRRADDILREGAASYPNRPKTIRDGSLQPQDRRFFESRFQHNFADVRVRADDAADASARALDARAYTTGNEIHFAAGEYRPDTRDGRRLLAHELAHVVQQRSSSPPNPWVIQRQPKQVPTKSAAPDKPSTKAPTLDSAGVDVADPVSGNTAQLIDTVLQRNQRLAPFIGERLKSGFKIAEKGHFVHEPSNKDFDNAYQNSYGDDASSSTMGFYDDHASTIHLRPGAAFGTALHEAIHRLAAPSLYNILRIASTVSSDVLEVLKEGVTAYFTDYVLKDEGLPNFNDSYRGLKHRAEALVAALGTDGFDVLAKFNFKSPVLHDLGKQLGVSDKQYIDWKQSTNREILKLIEKVI